MTRKEAIEILTEMQKRRRDEAPYDEIGVTMPYTPREFSIAIDMGIKALEEK